MFHRIILLAYLSFAVSVFFLVAAVAIVAIESSKLLSVVDDQSNHQPASR